MEFTVHVEKPSNILRKLTIKVPAQTVASRFERGLAEVAKTARLKGFRPGMVPMNVVKQFYGADVRHRVFHNLIDESYKQALRDNQIRAVSSPQIDTPDHQTGQGEHDHAIDEGKDLTFTATVEVLPEIEVKNYTGIPLTPEKSEITDEDVEKTISQIRDSQAQLVPATGGLAMPDGTNSRAVKKGDFVDMVFSGGIVTESGLEERPGMKGSRVLEVGSDSLIPGFEDQLIGMRQGETKTFRVPFPADYFEKDLQGKESEFTVTVNEVKEKQLPELNDDFAKQAGYADLADLRKQAREHLTRQKQTDADRKVRSDLLAALIENNAFDCPEALIEAQTRALAQDVAQNLKSQGFNDQMIQEALTAELANLKKRAENQVRASLILEAIAKKEDIKVDRSEFDGEIARMAKDMNVEEARLREYYTQNPQRLEDLEFRMREDRTVKFLLDKAKLKK
jgi:trigger factor